MMSELNMFVYMFVYTKKYIDVMPEADPEEDGDRGVTMVMNKTSIDMYILIVHIFI